MISHEETVLALGRGEVVVVPTDTVYGLAARFDSEEAVQKIYTLKGRGDKPLVILGASAEQLQPFSELSLDGVEWPGALTLVVPCRDVPAWVNGGRDTVGLRVPDHDGLRAVIAEVGPIVATSANRSGETGEEFFNLAVMEGDCGSGVPSRVVRWDGAVLRG